MESKPQETVCRLSLTTRLYMLGKQLTTGNVNVCETVTELD